jgi:hypothetical protein
MGNGDKSLRERFSIRLWMVAPAVLWFVLLLCLFLLLFPVNGEPFSPFPLPLRLSSGGEDQGEEDPLRGSFWWRDWAIGQWAIGNWA